MNTYNVLVGFQYTVNAPSGAEAERMAKQSFLSEVLDAELVTGGLEAMVEYGSFTQSHLGINYDDWVDPDPF